MFFRLIIGILIGLLFAPLGWCDYSPEYTLDVNIPSWTVDEVYGDNTVYSMPLINTTQSYSLWASELGTKGMLGSRGGLWMPVMPNVPSPGDARCLDDDCNYYLDISEVELNVDFSGKTTFFSGKIKNGGYMGMSSGSQSPVGGSSIYLRTSILPSSRISIRKRNTGPALSLPTSPKTVSFSFKACNPGSHYYYQSSCNSFTSMIGQLVHVNITVPPPTPPKVQCYMSPWSNNIDFQPVTVPVESGRAGAVTWPLGGGTFTGVEKQSASLNVQCTNIDAGVSELPLKVSLKGNGWEYGNNGELFFGTERNIAVATSLKMSANTGSLALDNDGSGCDSYWRSSGNNNFEMSAINTGNYLMSGGNQCSFTHQLPTPRSVVEEFRFTVDAVLGVSTTAAVNTPEYRKHQGALMLEVTMQ